MGTCEGVDLEIGTPAVPLTEIHRTNAVERLRILAVSRHGSATGTSSCAACMPHLGSAREMLVIVRPVSVCCPARIRKGPGGSFRASVSNRRHQAEDTLPDEPLARCRLLHAVIWANAVLPFAGHPSLHELWSQDRVPNFISQRRETSDVRRTFDRHQRRGFSMFPKCLKKIVLTVSALVLFLAAPTLAHANASSETLYFTTNGKDYRNRALAAVVYDGQASGHTYVGPVSGVTVPAGWVGAQGRIFNTNGALYCSGNMVYSSRQLTYSDMHYGVSCTRYISGWNFYSQGRVHAWNGINGYNIIGTYRTPNQTT